MKSYKANLLAALICILVLFVAGCQKQQEESSVAPVVEKKVVPVDVETIRRSDMKEEFTLPAGLEAWEDLIISAELSGPVEKIHFSEGDQVRRGDVLLEIDPDTLNSYLKRDQENVKVVTTKLKRYRQLEKEGLVSRQDVDDLQNSLTAAQASMNTTKIQLDKSKPLAPVQGIIDRIYIDRGEFTDIGKQLLRLVQVDRLKAIANVPEKDVQFLSVGQQVEVIPAAILGEESKPLIGTIEHIAYAADEMTRTYRTKIAVDNKTGTLRPGMIVRTRFVRRNLPQVIAVPLYAVIDKEGSKSVFVVVDDVVHEIPVTVGATVADRIIVTSGLKPKDVLVVKGQQLLVDGSSVSVRSTQP